MRSRLLSLASFVLAISAPAAMAEDMPVVTLASPIVSPAYNAEYVADGLGLWEKHGVHVKSVIIQGVGTINAVISGSADFGQTSALSFTRAAARGQRLLAIAETIDRPLLQIVLRRTLALQAGFDASSPLDRRMQVLKGRTIAIDSVGGISAGFLRLLARRASLDPDGLNLTTIPSPDMAAAFATGRIDGYVSGPPYSQLMLATGMAIAVASGTDGEPSDMIPFGFNLVVTRAATCARVILCRGIGESFAEAMNYIHDHPSQADALVRRRFPTIGDEIFAASAELARKATPRSVAVDRRALENANRFNVEAGLIKPDEQLGSYDGLYTDRFVQ